MLDAIDWIGRLAAGRILTDYRADRPLRDAVERNLEACPRPELDL